MLFRSLCNIGRFSASFEGVRMGAVDVFLYQGQGMRGGNRSIRHIRANPVDDFLIVMPLNVPIRVSQFGNEAIVEPGNFVFLTTQKPWVAFCGKPPNYIHAELMVRVPGPLLRQQIPLLDQCCALSIGAHQGAGKIMKQMIESILAEGRVLSRVQISALAAIIVNAIGVATLDAPELMGFYHSQRLHAHERVRIEAERFIKSNLSNPRLDSKMIARHCGISLRHLYASFAAASTTVAGQIRELRLQRCKGELVDPVMRKQLITQIAMKWGFGSATSFTRAYRTRFGKSPSEERLICRTCPKAPELDWFQ